MPDETTILSLPLILPAQAQKHVTHNEALVALDLVVQLAVIDRTRTVPPALPSVGDRHIVASGAVAEWAGQAGRIALYAETGWQFTAPLPGWRAHVLAEGATAVFDGLVWKAPSESPLTVPQLGVAATADATNRLTVSAPATLLNHAGGGHQLKLNKAGPGDTASLLFQTGFSGRAEMGTAGSDDFAVKVSADGAVWATALEAEAATGEVTLPQPLHLGGQAADPVAPPDGTLWLNTTSGEVKVRSGGATLPVGGGGGGISDGDKGDITVSGGGAVWSLDTGVVGLAKLADLATGRILGRATAGTGVPEALTGAEATALLGTFTSGAKGVAPASGGGTVNFLRADGTWAAPPGGGGSPGGATGEVQWNNGGAFAGAADVEIEGGQLRLPAIATPAAPAAGGVKLFALSRTGSPSAPAVLHPDGRLKRLQPDLSEFVTHRYQPAPNSAALLGDGTLPLTATGTATAILPNVARLFTSWARVEANVGTASTTAVSGFRFSSSGLARIGKGATSPGGFYHRCVWGPALGVATPTLRGGAGLLAITSAPTDVEPSTLVSGIWMGWDAADTNVQIMHNDASGAATKIDLGASFPVPTVDRTTVYELELYSPNSLTQSVEYRVSVFNQAERTILASATGVVTTNLPPADTALAPRCWNSVGGTSSVVATALFGVYLQMEY
jgi:hypothetical protein